MRRIPSIQALRGVAALSVVLFHIFENLKTYVPAGAGHQIGRLHVLGMIGVDLFFCISGFIMMAVIARGPEGESRVLFLTKRLVRIVPAYWLLTALLLAGLAVQRLGSPTHPFPRPGMIAASFFFIPTRDAAGNMAPVLGPGWTLSFEMFFYLVLSVAIPGRPARVARIAITALCALVLAGLVLQSGAAPLQVITSPLLVEFIFGMLIFLHGQRQSGSSPRLALASLAAAIIILGLSYAAVLSNDWQRLAIRGIPAGLLLLAALSARQSLAIWSWRPLNRLGDASYSLYLTHEIVLALLLRLCFHWHAPPLGLVVAAALVVTIGIALAFDRWVEKPMLRRVGSWAGRLVAAKRDGFALALLSGQQAPAGLYANPPRRESAP